MAIVMVEQPSETDDANKQVWMFLNCWNAFNLTILGIHTESAF
jgi:hypothetical protein